eukprot:jgi/Picsp_1/3381/NSC_06219-R1_protein
MSQLSAESESITIALFSCDLAYVYRVPPAGTSGHRAETWDVSTWLAEVRVRVFRNGLDDAYIHLEDPEKGELWAECPVIFPLHTCVERVIDSSRYFVIRVVDRDTGNHAFIGLGFRDRDSATDFFAALIDHQGYLERKERAEHMHTDAVAREQQDATVAAEVSPAGEGHGMSFKPGQTVQLKLNASHGGGFVSKKTHGKLAKTFSLMFDPHGGMEAALAPSSSGSSPKHAGASPVQSYSTEEEWGAFESPTQ